MSIKGWSDARILVPRTSIIQIHTLAKHTYVYLHIHTCMHTYTHMHTCNTNAHKHLYTCKVIDVYVNVNLPIVFGVHQLKRDLVSRSKLNIDSCCSVTNSYASFKTDSMEHLSRNEILPVLCGIIFAERYQVTFEFAGMLRRISKFYATQTNVMSPSFLLRTL